MRYVAMLVVVVVACPLTLRAQQAGVSPQCVANELIVQDACQKVIDLFRFAVPQLGTGHAAGSAVIGPAGTLGEPGKFVVAIRVNGVFAEIPLVNDVPLTPTGARSDTYPVVSRLVPVPSVDAAVGVFDGFAAGATSVLALDLLGALSFVPRIDADDLDLDVEGSSIRIGYGARVGLLQETIAYPAVSVSVLKRELPQFDLTATVRDDRLLVRDINIESTVWRLTTGKQFGRFGVHAAVGLDRYDMSAVTRVHVTTALLEFDGGPFAAAQSLTRRVVAVGATISGGALRAELEVGRAAGGDIETFNAFMGTSADAPRTFVTLGLQFGL